MAKEKDAYRANLERLDEWLPGKERLTIADVMRYTGRSRNATNRFLSGHLDDGKKISKVKLARLLS